MKKTMPARYQLLLMVMPFIIFIFLFSYVPLIGWIYAFFDYLPGVPLFKCDFVGLEYFKLIFRDKINMLRVMKNTMIFAGIGLLTMPLPMIFAICLNEIRQVRLKKVIQTFTTLPNFISAIIVYSLVFTFLSRDGVINTVLMNLGILSEPTNVLANGDAVYWFQTVLGQWKGLGWSAIIYIAAISGVDQELYEAADVDGAGHLGKALHVTIPALMPTFIVLLILGVGNILNTGYETYYLYKNPMTSANIEVLDLYVYRVGLGTNDYSYGIAISIMKTFVSVILISIANIFSKKIRGSTIF